MSACYAVRIYLSYTSVSSDVSVALLKKRWEALLGQGKRVIVVGDFNIAPFATDCCDAGPDFEDDR